MNLVKKFRMGMQIAAPFNYFAIFLFGFYGHAPPEWSLRNLPARMLAIFCLVEV